MIYLQLYRLEGIFNRHCETLVPDRVQVTVDNSGLMQQPATSLELHVRIAGP